MRLEAEVDGYLGRTAVGNSYRPSDPAEEFLGLSYRMVPLGFFRLWRKARLSRRLKALTLTPGRSWIGTPMGNVSPCDVGGWNTC